MTDGPGLSRQMGSAGTILLVDDNEANRILALRQLERLGYPARAVSNGREAVEAFGASTYALILMDCQMPEMNGFEATRQIRRAETPDVPRIPIVAMTASATDRDRDACAAAGMDDFITKPVMIQALGAVLGHWVGHQEPTRPAPRASTPRSVPDRTVDQVALARFRGELGEQAFGRFLDAYLSELPNRMDAIRRAVDDHVLDVCISSLRRKLDDDPRAPRFIGTVRGVGYRFLSED